MTIQRANEVWQERAALKKAIAADPAELTGALREHAECIRTMQVGLLLCTQQGWGLQRTRRMLKRFEISERTRCGELDEYQVEEICWGIEYGEA